MKEFDKKEIPGIPKSKVQVGVKLCTRGEIALNKPTDQGNSVAPAQNWIILQTKLLSFSLYLYIFNFFFLFFFVCLFLLPSLTLALKEDTECQTTFSGETQTKRRALQLYVALVNK